MATNRQREYLECMRVYFEAEDMLPPIERLADRMGVCKNAAWLMLGKLESAGYIEKNDNGKFKRGGRFPK